MIIVNLKTYPEITGRNKAVHLAEVCEEVHQKTQVPIIICVQATDLYSVASHVSIPVFAQHIDPLEPGKHTGFISALAVKESGASGVMINHSEHRLEPQVLAETVKIAKDNGLQTVVCVENSEEGAEIDLLRPDYIALEDPVLIGGEVSIVTNYAGKQKVVEFIGKNLQASCLVGAGVKGKEDVVESLKLGAAGVLLASGITLAQDPRTVLEDLVFGFQHTV